MKFTSDELEVIKDALIVALNHNDELLIDDIEPIINILDRIDDELILK